MSGNNLPNNDDPISRHQFYATVSSKVENSENAIGTIGDKLDKLSSEYTKVYDLVKASETRNKTLITAAVVVWALIGGSVGYYVQRSVASSDSFNGRFDALERKSTVWELEFDKRRDLPDRLEATKRIVVDVQRQLDELEVKKK